MGDHSTTNTLLTATVILLTILVAGPIICCLGFSILGVLL